MAIDGKFLGNSKGNSTLPCNVSDGALGSGESHEGSPSGKFLGTTNGNENLKPDRSGEGIGGSGESHDGSFTGKFLGTTNGNTNLPINRTKLVKEHT
jgi:hypothetical protein